MSGSNSCIYQLILNLFEHGNNGLKNDDTQTHHGSLANNKRADRERDRVFEHGMNHCRLLFTSCIQYSHSSVYNLGACTNRLTYPHTHTHTLCRNPISRDICTKLPLISPRLKVPPTAVVIFILPPNIHVPFQRRCIPNIRKLKNTVTPTREMVAGAVKNCL